MKLLFYNWTNFTDPSERGGGVRIYQDNVFKSIKNEHEVYSLTAGIHYTIWGQNKPYVRRLGTVDNIHVYQLVNSAVLAPSHLCFSDENTLHEQKTVKAFEVFLDCEGPFDVIQFDNFEGIPLSVIKLKRKYPSTKFIYTLHNYYALCPQVNLWYREKIACEDYNDGLNCVSCLTYMPNQSNARYVYSLRTLLKYRYKVKFNSTAYSFIYNLFDKILKLLSKNETTPIGSCSDTHYLKQIEYLKRRRPTFISMLNTYIDEFIAVSDRVKCIASSHGFDDSKISTIYIGTKHAEKFSKEIIKTDLSTNKLTIAYLGYMRKDKGYQFFLDALESMPIDLAGKINILIAAKHLNDYLSFNRTCMLDKKFESVTYYDGYTHDNLNKILEHTDLTIVPVLWEDNLPQVAIESVSHGVPVLSSHMGGAKELGNSSEFVFDAGDFEDFYSKLNDIATRKTLLSDFWENFQPPATMRQHITELILLYNK